MPSRSKNISSFFLVIFILIASFCGGVVMNKRDCQAQSSLLDAIRAWVAINPLEIDVSAPSAVEINSVFKVTVEVTNKGEEKIENAKGEIFLPGGLVPLKKNPIQKIGVIQGKKSKKVSWTVKGVEEGSYFVAASVAGELKGDFVSIEGSTEMISVEKFSEKPQSQKWYQNIFNFIRGWFDGSK